MARKKGNQQKKGVSNYRSDSPANQEKTNATESTGPQDKENLSQLTNNVPWSETNDSKSKVEAPTNSKQHKYKKSSKIAAEVADRTEVEEQNKMEPGGCDINVPDSTERVEMLSHVCGSPKASGSSISQSPDGLHGGKDTPKDLELSYALIFRLKSFCLSASKASMEWLERQKPLFIATRNNAVDACRYVQGKIEVAYPIILKWSMHFVNIVLLLFMVWLDCSLRGLESFLRMGTTSFFTVVWCSVLSITAMIGVFKFLLALVAAIIIGLFMGFTIALILMAISAITLLWLYGSFWTTMLVILFGGLAFAFGRERLALFIATSYSMYCVWASVGWVRLFFGLNLSFISSDVLIYILRNNMKDQRRSNNTTGEQASEEPGQSDFFAGGQYPASSAGIGVAGPSADERSGTPSTSGFDHEATSEDEVVRLLNCSDNYSAFGFARFENVDISVLKREYKKKAMLVHPDKNMGNEKAAEAFKKLQNAYEVLLDSAKRKAYDDELRREELLDYFRHFQETSHKSRGRGFFPRGFSREEADGEDPHREARRIACRKCGNFHVWFLTKKVKSKARWCQECKDFHQAKDGDGWVEQSSHPILFGMLQKVDPPAAFVCADGKIYDATEWYICQGMRCPANSHKPSFHVNTSITSKATAGGRGSSSSGQRSGGPIPTPNMEDAMTQEEFYEWFQNAVQSGMFDNFPGGGPPENSPSAQGKGGSHGGSGNAKRKKKGKKQ
ncbi:OLC1v1020554C1 [Oldenlandia corymbosa var. corymbosa]|uniref:OLC1v1020554C1 n=1 Tax=Oldenlandia corymbosa var. corymbosa TaxID=529605 RepID=A0AAV1EGN5_OLDCO|nr:OLC1v1020554C1 [Oldenlandia corymbosa var. corymbosa]